MSEASKEVVAIICPKCFCSTIADLEMVKGNISGELDINGGKVTVFEPNKLYHTCRCGERLELDYHVK